MSGKILEVRRLRKTFDGAPVLKDISFSVDRGEVSVIVGPSGCGKSTLLRCINGLERADGGEILLNGNRINTDAKDMYLTRRRIGMVFQSYELFPHLDVMGNLLLGPVKALRSDAGQVRAEASTLLKRVGLEGREHALPRTLSGGQKQRIALVRAMLMHPELLLLDEITAALDPEMVHEVLNVVLDLAADGMTMLIVTHEMRFAEVVADRILFLDEGLVAEESAPEFFSMVRRRPGRRASCRASILRLDAKKAEWSEQTGKCEDLISERERSGYEGTTTMSTDPLRPKG